MILDTLSSEVLDSGLTEKDHYDSTEQGCSGFAYDYMKDSPIAYGKDDIFDFQKVWYMRSLYTADELAAFFALPFLNRNERLSIRKETDPCFWMEIPMLLSLDIFLMIQIMKQIHLW